MSLLKSVPEGLKSQECECTKLRELLPVPYVPTKDEVQEEDAKLRNLEIKTTIKKDTTLNFLVWHKNGTRKTLTDARDSGTRHNQETWSLPGLGESWEGSQWSKESCTSIASDWDDVSTVSVSKAGDVMMM